LLRSLGFELIVTTSRSLWVEEATKYWLSKHFGDVFLQVTFGHNHTWEKIEDKSHTCKKNGVLLHIEDNPVHVEDLRRNNVPILLFSQHWNLQVKECSFVRRAANWQEAAVFVKGLRLQKTL